MKTANNIVTELQAELKYSYEMLYNINKQFTMMYKIHLPVGGQINKLRKLKERIQKKQAIYDIFDSEIIPSEKEQIFGIYDIYEDRIVTMYNLHAYTPEGHESVIWWNIKLLVSLICHLKKINQ